MDRLDRQNPNVIRTLSRKECNDRIKELDARHHQLKEKYSAVDLASIGKDLEMIEMDILWYESKLLEMDTKNVDFSYYN